MEKHTQSEEQIEKKEELMQESTSSENKNVNSGQSEVEKEEELNDPFKKLQDDLSEAKDKYVRLYAEFDNHRRRTSKEKLDLIQNANEELIVALLPILDDFDRAEKASTKTEKVGAEGFLLIKNKLVKVLDQYGVKEMEMGAGSDFDSDLHEAITQAPTTEESMKGKIVDVIEKGYLLNEKVIRYAKVVIGN
ncbi:MAG TPA: nucleotide exchange factor GrpE [Cyclobacteriaceae bacterium]|nr:nucleotide exchange factor GrpE [Cyclobacteriaceae bacterium]HRK52357.1 nucleotide exchange factor GrpE [Cyclobacteriaceae bacterium]